MLPQMAAEKLLESLHAPPGAVTIWPWHEDDGRVTMIVVINSLLHVDIKEIPQQFEGFNIKVERRSPPMAGSI